MAIEFEYTIQDDLIIVTTTGFDESLEEAQEYGFSVLQVFLENNCRRVLVDERNLEYRLNTFDIYQLATVLAEHAPGVARAALVCNPQYISDGTFWETVTVNRGLQTKVFTSYDEALKWLENDPS